MESFSTNSRDAIAPRLVHFLRWPVSLEIVAGMAILGLLYFLYQRDYMNAIAAGVVAFSYGGLGQISRYIDRAQLVQGDVATAPDFGGAI